MIDVMNVNKSFKRVKMNPKKGAASNFFNREYETVNALKDVSFKINEGEMVGYIGPNGAGKSSTIKILCGVLTPDSGKCVINGKIPWKDRVNYVKDIGVVFGQRTQLWWDIPVIESFQLLKEIYSVSEEEYKKNLHMLTDLLDIEKIIYVPTRQLSLGQRMCSEIAASLLHSPKILFLDEPTIGLDAVSKKAVREFIRKINYENKTTVILTTHDMQDIETITKRIILIGKGQILLDGSIDALKEKYNQKKILNINYIGDVPHLGDGFICLKSVDGHMEIEIDTTKKVCCDVISELTAKVQISDLSILEKNIEDIIVEMYKEYRI